MEITATQKKFENKYNKIIARTIKQMSDNTMQELFVALDIIKAKMCKEAEEKGIKLVT